MTAVLLRGARLVDVTPSLRGGSGAGAEVGGGAGPPDRGPQDVLVVDGLIAATGRDLVSTGPPVEVVDLEGRWVVPGLWDAHTHMTQWALARQRVDVSSATSASEAASLVTARLRSAPTPAGVPLVGFGFRDALWPDEPTAALLDAAVRRADRTPADPAEATGTAVVLISGDLHCGWLSSAAARLFGRAQGGLLREHEWFAVLDRLGGAPVPTLDAWVADAALAAATRGVVGVVDFERSSTVEAWRRRVAAGQRGLRVVCSTWPEELDAVVALGLRTGDVVPVHGSTEDERLVTMGALKIISDGSLNTRTAYCHDPYPGLVGDDVHGLLSVPPDELAALLTKAHGAGLRCAVHAIGDRAGSLALDAFAATGARGSIEHAQLLTDDDVVRLADLGLTASVQPEHAMDDRDVADRFWSGRTGRAFAFWSLHRAGVPLALGSDAPVAPLDPWLAIGAAVDRARDGRDPWHPEQRLPVAVALAASTRGRAVVRPGDPADLAVLEVDPLGATGAGLREMPVAATMLAGRWTHRQL